MRIEENKVYVFTFDTGDHGNLAIPVRGETREAAAQRLQQMFGQMQAELAMEVPRIAAGPVQPNQPSTTIAEGAGLEGLSEILVERIDTLMIGLGAAGLTDKAKAETVKNWTELEYSPENYAKIVTELELIASGQKEVPVKPKKKA